jgi:hypothetical protein
MYGSTETPRPGWYPTAEEYDDRPNPSSPLFTRRNSELDFTVTKNDVVNQAWSGSAMTSKPGTLLFNRTCLLPAQHDKKFRMDDSSIAGTVLIGDSCHQTAAPGPSGARE